MRKAINENPVVQITLIVVLAAAVGLIFFIQMGGGGGGGDDVPPPAPAASQPEGTVTPQQPQVEMVEISSVMEPGPGLPRRVVDAYDDGKTVLVAITEPDAMIDRNVREMAETLAEEDDDIALFLTRPDKISDFSRITLGVDVNRHPVLVVLSPLGVTGEGSPPRAWTSYGYRSLASMRQAVVDARFNGPTGSLAPS